MALVHDYLLEYGGAERVLEALHEIFPEAPIYTAYLDLKSLGPHEDRVKNWNIKTSWIQNLPFGYKLISPLRIFAPMIFESFDLSEYDLVISSCSIYFSKAIITKPEALHISYIHTPPRYLYGYTTSFNYKKNILTRILGELANHFLRIWDFETSQRPDILVANSKNIAQRIKKFYRRDSVIIYPPVDVEGIRGPAGGEAPASRGERQGRQVLSIEGKENYFLSLSRLVRGKGVDLIVKACTELNVPLKVVGSGPELSYLKKIAGKNIEFLGHVSDEERIKLYAEAKAFIVASEDEDFGITAVEAMAAGTPVIAPKTGGYLETVTSKTGVFFYPVTVEALIEAIKNFDPKKFKKEDLQNQAEKFSENRFKKEILELVRKHAPNA